MSVVGELDKAIKKKGETSASTALEAEGLDELAGMFHLGNGGIAEVVGTGQEEVIEEVKEEEEDGSNVAAEGAPPPDVATGVGWHRIESAGFITMFPAPIAREHLTRFFASSGRPYCQEVILVVDRWSRSDLRFPPRSISYLTRGAALGRFALVRSLVT